MIKCKHINKWEIELASYDDSTQYNIVAQQWKVSSSPCTGFLLKSCVHSDHCVTSQSRWRNRELGNEKLPSISRIPSGRELHWPMLKRYQFHRKVKFSEVCCDVLLDICGCLVYGGVLASVLRGFERARSRRWPASENFGHWTAVVQVSNTCVAYTRYSAVLKTWLEPLDSVMKHWLIVHQCDC